MPKTWITDLKHFLDEEKGVGDLPKRAAQLAMYFGSIVEAVTGQLSEIAVEIGVKCRGRLGDTRCAGEIFAYMDDDEEKIIWECFLCDEKGVITGWPGTVWDKRPQKKI
jgi:hypothetical protein